MKQLIQGHRANAQWSPDFNTDSPNAKLHASPHGGTVLQGQRPPPREGTSALALSTALVTAQREILPK